MSVPGRPPAGRAGSRFAFAFEGPTQGSPNAGAGPRYSSIQIFVSIVDGNRVAAAAAQRDDNPAVLIDAAPRPIDIGHSHGDPLDGRSEAAQRELQTPVDVLAQLRPRP
ncbi:MAG: hypothetical protein A2W31_11625 [Planctomycetes bacterium RBG_16_64_10]|nr:MAG: hypothetical protein A2W31_11625 [Planctomycetes bacterium RBG_16_64_10]